jgi:predicted AAA+ superfamily ATPase
MVIDEVQRAPDIFLAMKELVDAEPTPGRFLLTGSARILGLRGLPDALPGRMETYELWPLAQGEIEGSPDGFVQALFSGRPVAHTSDSVRADYAARIVRGGFPEAVARSGRRRERFLESYISDLINRDVIQLAAIERGHHLRTLLDLLVGRVGQVFTVAGLARVLGLSQQTVERYIGLLEEVFLIKRVPGWGVAANSRATAAPKLAFVDSGVAAGLLGADETSLLRADGPLGPLLESFVVAEIARQLPWVDQTIELFHYRTRDQVEVDIVLQNRRRQVVAIEVKASATARDEDFRGIRHLQARLGDDLTRGIVLYLGHQTLPFGENLQAVPVDALWRTPA